MGDWISSLTVGLPVADLREATEWYRAVFGSRPVLDPAPGVREFEVVPHTWLQLLASEQEVRSAFVVRIGVGDIEAEYERVRELGIDPSPIHTVSGVVRYFDFHDPYGNRLSFYQVIQDPPERTA